VKGKLLLCVDSICVHYVNIEKDVRFHEYIAVVKLWYDQQANSGYEFDFQQH
jgi:hypothetical protein